MPIPGYIGFLVFGLETMTFVNFLKGRELYKKPLYPVILIALVLSILSFSIIDRYTVFSYTTKIDSISFIEPGKLDSLKNRGVKTSYGIDMNLLDREERASITLLHLKGLGYDNFLKLREHGIRDVEELSQYNETTLSQILGEKNPRRVRVYIKAARRYSKQ
ncbi:MAG: hypothetical protein NTU90_00720 [Proteobacteria bacterium]|nr:hypothetical protein [Pseudomonadota bacterium]